MSSHDEVYSITSARTGLSAEQSGRTRRYLISMLIRTVCFLGAVVADGWLRWVLLAGAVILPYFAVVIANAGRENGADESPSMVLYEQRPQITAGPRDGSRAS